MPEYSIQQIANIVNGSLQGNPNQVIKYLETDSRKATSNPQTVFIALRGKRHDGHQYINQVITQGIPNIIAEELPHTDKEANVILVNNSLIALQQLAKHYRGQLSMPIVAITGSNGKTVVKEWLAQCLSFTGSVSRSPKSYNSQLGVPLSLWMAKPNSDWTIIEAGISEPGEMKKLEKIISPDYGIFTNLGPAHQENFKNEEEKAYEKLKLFHNVKVLYYCSDHILIHKLASNKHCHFKRVCWSYSDPEADLLVDSLLKTRKETRVQLTWHNQKHSIAIPFTDKASLENCLHIITFLLDQEQKISTIQKAIKSLSPVAMRLEHIKGIQGSTLINDSYNSDIHSLRIALDYLSIQKQHSKRTVILSDILQSGQKTEELHTNVAELIGSYKIDQLVLVGVNMCKSAVLPQRAIRFKTTHDLLQHLPVLNIHNHVVLIKGAREYHFEDVVANLSEKKHTTVLEINQNNLVHNLNYFRGLLQNGTKIMVMVKALSYGSGSYEIASLLQHQKVDYLGVAFTDEGVALRKAGITLPIMVMSPSEESFDDIIEYKLEPEIYDVTMLKSLSAVVAKKQMDQYPVHIKLDTGMHRLGFMPTDISLLAQTLTSLSNIHVKALFSHLAVSSNPNEDEFTQQQLASFDEMFKTLTGKLSYTPMRHILNSAGIERFPNAHYSMVRLGIGLHGISATKAKLLHVGTLKTQIVQIKHIIKTDTIGYNRKGKLNRDSDIAIIPIGYADGLNRKLGNHVGQVVINGQKAPFIGDICMDMSMIDITDIHAHQGDEVIIFGEQNPVELIAEQLETIPYEILTSISARVKRVYINE